MLLCLGAFAWDAALRLIAARSRPARRQRQAPALRARRRAAGERYTLIGCYHPSQQNTFTGRLTAAMIDAVLERARALASVRAGSVGGAVADYAV